MSKLKTTLAILLATIMLGTPQCFAQAAASPVIGALEYYSTPVLATRNGYNNPEFRDFNDQGVLILVNYREGGHYKARAFTCTSNRLERLQIPGGMGSTHESQALDINNNNDVLLNVNYCGNVKEQKPSDKVVVRYADGRIQQVNPPDWACPSCIWVSRIDDNRVVYGVLGFIPGTGDRIPFSWKDGLYDFFSYTPPTEPGPPFTLTIDPGCSPGQFAVQQDNHVTCIGEAGLQSQYRFVNSAGQIFGSSIGHDRRVSYFIWTLDMRTPQNALEALTHGLNELLQQNLLNRRLWTIKDCAESALHAIQNNRQKTFCSHYKTMGRMIASGADSADLSHLKALYEQLGSFVGDSCP